MAAMIELPMYFLYITVGIFIIGAAGLYFLGMYWLDVRTKTPEVHVFMKSRKHPYPPTVAIVDNSDRIMFFSGTKEKIDSIKLKIDKFLMKLDPRLATGSIGTSRLVDGSPILFYGADLHFPVGTLGPRALISLVKEIRENHKKLDFIGDDPYLIAMLGKKGEVLATECKKAVQLFLDEDPDEDEITKKAREVATEIEAINKKLSTWNIRSGSFSIAEGLKLLPLPTVSADLERVESITKTKVENDNPRTAEDWMKLALAAAVIFIGAGIAYKLLS